MNFSDPTSSESALAIKRRNFRNVEIDAVGIGLASAAGSFLPVFLTRLGASNTQVGLLAAMPGVTGLVLAIAVGRFLQTRRNIVPWFSLARLLVVSSYALTGLVTLIIPPAYRVTAVLVIWAAATLPQTMTAVAFAVVMNAVAGPDGRYVLMSRRWSILGLTTAVTTLLVGQILHLLQFPLNYQLVFLGLSLGGLISYYFSSRIKLPDTPQPPRQSLPSGKALRQGVANYLALVRSQPAFVSFAVKRFVYLSGVALGGPLFPLYFVRQLHASDAWIGFINTSQTFILLAGYFLWPRLSRRRGGRFVLLCTTLAMAFYPAAVAVTRSVWPNALYAAFAGIFQAGLDLVFFDELMKTVPVEYSATFVSLAQSLQYLSTIAAPMIGTFLADHIGLSGALLVSAALRLIGFGLFAASPGKRPESDD